MRWGCANCVTEAWPPESVARIARRVGSASAEKGSIELLLMLNHSVKSIGEATDSLCKADRQRFRRRCGGPKKKKAA